MVLKLSYDFLSTRVCLNNNCTFAHNHFTFRPFERTLTLHKDSLGHVGFQFKDGRIVGLVKDSSAARNGMLTDHQLLEINTINVVGMKDKEISKVIENSPSVVNITVIPCYIYKHMISQ